MYNVAAPSLETIISKILWKDTVTLRISTHASAGCFAVNYGATDDLATFPLHNWVNALSATIKTSTVSFHVQWELGVDPCSPYGGPDEFAKYDSRTRTTLALCSDYRDAISYMDWQLDVPNSPYPKYPLVCPVDNVD